MNQRFLTLALTGALTLTLAACSGGVAESTPPPASLPPVVSASPLPSATVSPTETPMPTETPSPETSETPTPSETPQASIAPAPTAKPTTAPTAKPTVKPTAVPTAKPTQTPAPTVKPTAPPAPQVSKVQQVWDEIAKKDLPSLMDVDSATLSSLYGISSSDLEEYVCKMPMMNVTATEFFVAKVKDGKMDTVKAGAEKRQAALEAEWASYLPEQYEMVQNYKLKTNGNYILFVISEHADAAVTAFNTYTK